MYKKRVKHLYKPRVLLTPARLSRQTLAKVDIQLYKPFFDSLLPNNQGKQTPSP